MNWLYLITILISSGITIALTPSIIGFAGNRQLYDNPDHRKQHKKPIAPLGGIAIFVAFWLTLSLIDLQETGVNLAALMSGSLLLFVVNIKDDLDGIRAWKRLCYQIVTVLICLAVAIPTLSMVSHLPLYYSSLLMGLIFLAFLTNVNAYNMIDGINGLAGTLGFVAALTYAVLFGLQGNEPMVMVSMSLAGGIIGFLYFNFGVAKIFMGDNGATFIGLILAVFGLLYTMSPAGVPLEDTFTATWWGRFGVSLAISCVPIFDLLMVSIRRIVNGKHPFAPDRTHIHHLLSNLGIDHRRICIFLGIWTIVMTSLAYVFSLAGILILPLLLLLGALPYVGIRIYAPQHKINTSETKIKSGNERTHPASKQLKSVS